MTSLPTDSVTANVVSLRACSCVSPELHRLAEGEDEVDQVQEDCFHLDEFHSLSFFFRVFFFLASSLASNFASDLSRKFLKGISRMVIRSVGRIQRSLFWSSNEHYNLEVQEQDCRRSLGLKSPSEPSPSARLQYLRSTSCPQLVLSLYSVCAHACGSRIFL